jgi:hypothetical protein
MVPEKGKAQLSGVFGRGLGAVVDERPAQPGMFCHGAN